ncbi:MAG TPA: hypothetical protein VGF70_05065 [Solirubrobacteraceae bacterium]
MRPVPAGRTRAGKSRATDRHYLAVVAGEARRLARQLRPPAADRGGSRQPLRGQAGAKVLP